MNTLKVRVRRGFARACLAALFALVVTACSFDSDREVNAKPALPKSAVSVADLQPLVPGSGYSAPYDKQFKMGEKCLIVTYSFEIEGRGTLYEYKFYGPGGEDDIIGENRGETEEAMNILLNTVPTRCN